MAVHEPPLQTLRINRLSLFIFTNPVKNIYVLAFALMMFSGAGLSACGGGDSSTTNSNAKYTSTGLAKGAWFWKVTATGFKSETRTFTVQ